MGVFDEWMSKFEDGAKAPSTTEQPMTPLAASFRPLSPQGQKVREDFVRDRSVGTALATDLSSAFGGDLPARAKAFEPAGEVRTGPYVPERPGDPLGRGHGLGSVRGCGQ